MIHNYNNINKKQKQHKEQKRYNYNNNKNNNNNSANTDPILKSDVVVIVALCAVVAFVNVVLTLKLKQH